MNTNKNQKDTSPSLVQKRILESAKTLFAKKGFKATTTKMIAAEADVNEVTVFRHFKSKENLLNILVEQSFQNGVNETLAKCLEKDIESVEEVEEMLIDFGVTFYNNYLLANREIVFINLFEFEERPEMGHAMSLNIKQLVKMLVEKLNVLNKKGIIKNNVEQVAALLYIQSMMGTFLIQHRLKVDFFPFTAEELCSKATKVLLNGIAQ